MQWPLILASGILFGQLADPSSPQPVGPRPSQAVGAGALSTIPAPSDHPPAQFEGPPAPIADPSGDPTVSVLQGQAADAPARPTQGKPTRGKPTPAGVVAEVFALPAMGQLPGEPLPLEQMLGMAGDRRRQLAATHAYWHLAEALGRHRFRRIEHEWLGRFEVRSEDITLWRTAMSAAAVGVGEEELAIVSAQHELAEVLSLPPDTPLPLPADLPHVGSYDTHLEEIFVARMPPPRARLISRTLPLRRRAIAGRLEAVIAAADALGAMVDAYTRGRADW
ncbi:MAG: hypothetical protein HQ581_01465, partial [Planctomycetes bacterium]|nr:hypothetical protein [Planctomycetota bacterium]